MLSADWHFKERAPGDKIRDPIQGEFFSTEGISDFGEALVREGIQNSLDASDGKSQVRVRLFLSGAGKAASGAQVAPFLTQAWEHLQASRNGLKDIPKPKDNCPFLLFEDFGTTGLTGNPEQWVEDDENPNAFFYFFRAEGKSTKGEKDGGRWGVGKYVFPRSSRINTFYGITIRHDDARRLLMGETVLKAHLMNGKPYTPDGYYGIRNNEGLVLPIDDAASVEQFSKTFSISRNTEPGLSIVMPWPFAEITFQSLLAAVIRQFFYAILSNKLVVTVAEEGREIQLDKSSILNGVELLDAETRKELSDTLKLAFWACEENRKPDFTLSASPADRAPRWLPGLLPAELAEEIRTKYLKCVPLHVRVPVYIKKGDSDAKESYFDVVLVRNSGAVSGKPIYIRGGIIISDVHGSRARSVDALVLIQHETLAAMLGDSENPAHTQWQKDGSKFKDKYKHGPSTLDFVANSVSQLVQLISGQSGKDETLLADIFSLPASDQDETAIEVTSDNLTDNAEGKKGKKEIKVPPTTKRPRFVINKLQGGFSLEAASGNILPETHIRIRLAYNTRRGNPFTRYTTADFNLNTDIKIDSQAKDLEIISQSGNTLVARVKQTNFKLAAKGFDVNRDLAIQVREINEASH